MQSKVATRYISTRVFSKVGPPGGTPWLLWVRPKARIFFVGFFFWVKFFLTPIFWVPRDPPPWVGPGRTPPPRVLNRSLISTQAGTRIRLHARETMPFRRDKESGWVWDDYFFLQGRDQFSRLPSLVGQVSHSRRGVFGNGSLAPPPSPLSVLPDSAPHFSGILSARADVPRGIASAPQGALPPMKVARFGWLRFQVSKAWPPPQAKLAPHHLPMAQTCHLGPPEVGPWRGQTILGPRF